MRRTPLDPKLVRDRLDYRDDGALVWRAGVSRMAQPGAVAGCQRADGRWVITMERRTINRASAVWAWHHGEFPKGCLRHLNDDISDDRIANLHEESFFERAIRIRGLSAGLPGATRQPSGKWQANIHTAGVRYYLGLYDSEQEAHEAHARAHAMFHGNQSPYFSMYSAYPESISEGMGVHKCS